MDWTDLSNRLAEGAKVYKAFQDGANAASMLGGFERAQTELSAQYDALVAKINQANADVQAARDEAARIRAQTTQDAAQRVADFDATYAKRIAAAEIEFDTWNTKITTQAANYAAEANSWKDQVDALTKQAGQLDAQIQSLLRVRDSLKSQLQSVV